MFDKRATILSDNTCAPASSQVGDMHDFSKHDRYCGSSASNGGERILERRSGTRPRNVCGF